MRIAVVGSGYVGLVAGACFADLGHDVILVDNDQRKLAALKNGQVPIHEKFLPELLSRHRGQRLTFSDDLQEAVRLSSAIFVAVGTPPTESGEADLVLRGIGGPRNFRRHRRLQSHRREKHRPGLHQRLGAQDHPAQRHRPGDRSTSLRIRNFCAKAPPSPISSFPTAS